MTIENDFIPFAVGGSANVISQATYAADTTLTQGGFTAGIATSAQLNKVWRQSSIMAAVIASFIVAETGQTAIDDGTTATLLANFTNAVNAASKNKIVLTDTGTANAYAAANPVPLTALPTSTGFTQTVKIAHLNTGTSTYAPDGLATAPIYGLGGAVLQGGELPVNGVATLVSFVDPLLNSGSLCWVLYECVGGAQQVAPATQPTHALQQQQKGYNRATSSGSLVVPPGVTTMFISAVAPGGGGASGGPGSISGTSAWAAGGGAGGAGQSLIRQPFAVVPGSTINWTMGAAGTGGNSSGINPGNSGTAGGNLVISGSGFNGGISVTLPGGSPGSGGSAVTSGNATGGAAGVGFPAGGYGNDATNNNASGSGGAGASSPFGGGGGAARSAQSGSVAGGNAGGFGAGGGGGSGVYSAGAGNGGPGGSGSGGFIMFEW